MKRVACSLVTAAPVSSSDEAPEPAPRRRKKGGRRAGTPPVFDMDRLATVIQTSFGVVLEDLVRRLRDEVVGLASATQRAAGAVEEDGAVGGRRVRRRLRFDGDDDVDAGATTGGEATEAPTPGVADPPASGGEEEEVARGVESEEGTAESSSGEE